MTMYKPVSNAYRADNKSIRNLLFEICEHYSDRKFIMKSEVFHSYCREGACNYSIRYCNNEDGSTLLTFKGPIIKGFVIECIIYAHPNEYGVDSEIEEIYFQGELRYQKPQDATEAVLLF